MKRKTRNRIFLTGGLLAAGFIIYAGVQADRLAKIGAGYKAKVACSEIFLAGRDRQTVLDAEFEGMDPLMKQVGVRVSEEDRTARAAGPLGFGQARALYRDGYGCTLANGGRVSTLPGYETSPTAIPWDEARAGSEAASGRVDYAALDAALNAAFEPNDLNHRAVLVAVDGAIVAERYADGFTRDTPLLSWSMGKSVTATLIGAAVLDGYIDLGAPAPAAEWRADPARARITWNDLLQMQSGLAFEEEYGKARSAVNRMLFEATDAGGLALRSRAEAAPGEVWYYSSGTTNILARLFRETLARSGFDDQQFARSALFDPLGAASFVLEPDASGAFIGSSFVYATARDWARLGQLYLEDGVWNGERLLPEGWADYVATPAAASDDQYGAQFWLNRDGANGRERFVPGLPEDVYFMSGHEGQYVYIVPSKRMVIVRAGITRDREPQPATAPLLKAIYDAVGDPAP